MNAENQNLLFFLSLEERVWQALQSGDAEADRALLSEQFLGVYPSGCRIELAMQSSWTQGRALRAIA